MTLEKIRAALPTHIMLVPGQHYRKDGDEIITMSGHVRRPIPSHILDNQALWLWLGAVEGTEQTPPLEEIEKAHLLTAWQNLAYAGRLYDKWLLEQME